MKLSATEIAANLFKNLWVQYLQRVSYAKSYSELVVKKGGQIVIDHIAFRTFNTHTGEQPEGIRALRHILLDLGYKPASKYMFQKKKLSAVHFEHQDEALPKIFVSQLEVDQLPGWAQELIHKTVKDTPYLLSDHSIELLNILKEKGALPFEAADFLVRDMVNYFCRPWNIPNKEDVLKLNDLTQYGTWVLLHGNSVNHFAVSLNDHNITDWGDLESASKALENAGVPMKSSIEGEKESKLRQTSTLSVKEEVEIRSENAIDKMTWTYAYLELAKRGYVEENGEKKRFNGFLGEQEVHLFDMTKTRDN